MRDGARHAGLAEGRRELASDLYWRYRGVVKAGENKAGQHDVRVHVGHVRNRKFLTRLRILKDKHDHLLAGHFGINKTTELVCHEYTWPGVRKFVNDFCSSCTTCHRSKALRHKPYGLIKQLLILLRPWDSISMDFIEHLPKSSGFTAILIIVDRLSKQGIFIPTMDSVDSAGCQGGPQLKAP